MIKLSRLFELAKKKFTQKEVIYEPPTHGPFMCARCEYFGTPNNEGNAECKIVEGVVNAKGCCIKFERK